jgi:hypothetical protein
MGQNWAPVGTSGTAFTGSFDGGNKTISNLYINNRPETGFFGYSSRFPGNIHIGTGSAVSGIGRVGGICGFHLSSITGCSNTGAVSDTQYGGAITACYWLDRTGDNAVYGIGSPASDTNAAKFAGGVWPLGTATHVEWGWSATATGASGQRWKSLRSWNPGSGGLSSTFPKLWWQP